MKKVYTVVAFMLVAAMSFSQKKVGYQFTLDLTNTSDDKIAVELRVPAISQDEIIYNIPKIVPGTYSEDDFGRYVEGFEALDKKGKPLPVTKTDINGWKINNAKSLYKIKYKVNDTFDDADTASKKVFEPCGSNIQDDTNYVINTHCFLGYFDGMKQVPYTLTVIHPSSFYGTTAMEDADKSNTKDLFTTESYNRIVDNPIMYCRPDTAVIDVGESKVLIGVYSPNKKVTASFLAENFTKLLQAQAQYLGGKLPVKKYAFLIYLTDHEGVSGSNGALEHSYSSTYFMPEGEPKDIMQFVMDVSAHEFFHIVTPLSIHSEEIHYFDFNTPKMSKHLWLYEGTTEYHAHIAQEKAGLISRQDFLDVISQKITNSRQRFNDTLSFTAMSAGCLHEYANQYGNVYQKGALIAMCLDIKMRQLSNGQKGIMDIINGLAKIYGKDKPFKDDELFDVIGNITYPEIKDFLLTYVEGTKPLPLEEIFSLAGIKYDEVLETKDSSFTLGRISFTQGNSDHVMINNISSMNEFGKKMGYKVNDEIMSLNGTDITFANFNQVVNDLYKAAHTGDLLTIIVKRKNDSGGEDMVTLSAPMMKIPVKKFNQLSFIPNPSQEQLMIQNAWLGEK